MKMIKDFKVDFICIGAVKSGTTFLYNVLDTTDMLDLSSLKEPSFFTENYHFGYDWYENLWKDNGKLKGEFTAHYFYKQDALKKIKEDYPDVKIVLILRDPYERAVSHIKHFYRIGAITNLNDVNFIKNRVIERSLYYNYLVNLFEIFDVNNIEILYFNDLRDDLPRLIDKLRSFLGLETLKLEDGAYIPKGEGYMPKFVFLERFKNFIYYILIKMRLDGVIKRLTGSKIVNLYKRLNKSSVSDDNIFYNAIDPFKEEIRIDLQKIKSSELNINKNKINHWLENLGI